MNPIIPMQDIAAVTDRDTQGKRVYHEAYVLPESDVDYTQLPTVTETAAVRTMTALVLKEAATGWRKFSFVKNTFGGTSEGSAGDITTAVSNTLTGTLGGDRIEIDNLIQDQMGSRCFVVVVDRLTGEKKIWGRPYAPMELRSFSKRMNADNTSCDVTFANDFHFQPLKYLGSVEPEPEETVVDANSDGETTLGGES